ncbi:hypothetical protein [Bradyrhizobium arachidis]|uniref:hypothetical protein n=1 Tax=Bradyrhizobium arachidis TaxID=858423 RepID=UPI0021622371|nr:hypothetical protein [Bradyrhizobium arachidis]UVO26989.1 hypothetical protein KUF59_31260 [Bradyrhizobium arachidis]
MNPDSDSRYEGLCWGIGHAEAFAEGRGDASSIREALASEMPQAGEDRRPVADIFASVCVRCVEFLAGRAAERMLLDGEPAVPADDLRQARELALLFCKSDEAVESFLAHCDIAARDLLTPYGDLLMVLSTLMRIKRTLDGAEIDKIIWGFETHKALAIERGRGALAERDPCERSRTASSLWRSPGNELHAVPGIETYFAFVGTPDYPPQSRNSLRMKSRWAM